MNEILLNKVKDYFSGNLSREGQALLESERATNHELATIFDLYQTIGHGIAEVPELAQEEALLRNTLKGAHQRFLLKHTQQAAAAPLAAMESHLATQPEAETQESKVVHLPPKETGKLSSMHRWKRLAVAAAVTGILITAAAWFLRKDKSDLDFTAVNRETTKPPDTVTPGPVPLPAPLPEDYTAKQDVPKPPGQKVQEPKKPAAPTLPGRTEQEKLYARNFRPDALLPDYSELLQEALNQYKGSEYGDAVAAIDIKAIETYMEEIRPRGQQDEQLEKEARKTLFYAHYYKALSYMGAGKAEKAISAFQQALAKSPDKYWQSKAQWYLALAYLKNGKLKEATVRLKQVAQSGKPGEYRQKAIKLISELEGSK